MKRSPVILGCLLLAGPLPADPPPTRPWKTAPDAPRAIASDRSRELYDYECHNDLGKRQVTLFANGTVRLRQGLREDPEMRLGELDGDQVAGYVRRLRRIDAGAAGESFGSSPEGDWVEHCAVMWEVEGGVPNRVTYGRFDSQSLALSELVRLGEELAEKADLTSGSRLALDYQARVGDVLRRVDRVLFEVVAYTADGKGVELQGVEQPLTVYIGSEDLREQFVELVERDEIRGAWSPPP